jgi:peptidoglycan/LPS O-acetylase OafA/YrhL
LTTATPTRRPPTAGSTPSPEPRVEGGRAEWFRPDIEGLRAVAVLLVVLYHAKVPGLTGGYLGVDVFFVISGFLITSVLLRELGRSGRISIPRFYARRFVRLLPAAAVVTLLTLVAAWWWLPATRFHSITADALFTTVYGLNYDLAARGADYLHASDAPSPLQHFWSLAVEEQFYLVWPLLLAVASLAWMGHASRASRRHGISRTSIAMVLGVVIVGSLALSGWQTSVSAPWAYFGAHTRAWELGCGALVAVYATECARIPRRLAVIVGWLGLAAVIIPAFEYDQSTPFPGYFALAPVGGAVAIIAVGCSAPMTALRLPGLQSIGRLSYSWYLWHWPVLLIAPFALGAALNLIQRLTFAALALGAAALTFALVEDPIRRRLALRSQARRGITLGLALSGTVAAVAIAGALLPPRPVAVGDRGGEVATTARGPDAARQLADLIAASAANTVLPSNLTPTLLDAPTDNPRIYRDGCHRETFDVDLKLPCMYGDTTARNTIVIFGDSHAAHWFDALDTIAKQRKMRLAVLTKSSCSAAAAAIFHPVLKREYAECDQWRESAWRYINTLAPSVVVMSSNGSGGNIVGTAPADQNRAWTQAWLTSIKQLRPSGAKIVLIADTPWLGVNTPDCVSVHPRRLDACTRSPDQALLEPARRASVAAAATQLGVKVVDPVSWFCTTTTCPAVIGNALVYHDESHMTTSYSAALAPVLATQIP